MEAIVEPEGIEQETVEVAGNAEGAETPSSVFQFPTEGTVKIGDQEFPAQEFQNRYRSQSDFDRAVQAQQKKLRQQYESHYNQQFQDYQQKVRQHLAQQQARPQGGQGGGPPDLGAVFKAMRERAYAAPDDIEALVQHISPQLAEVQQLKDQLLLMQQEMQRDRQGYQALQQHRVSQETDGLVRQIQQLDSDLLGDDEGKEVIMDVLKSHEPSPGETLEDFKESIQQIASKRLQWALGVGKKHQSRELDRARRVKATGIPGSGGLASPTGKAQAMMDPEEYAKLVFAQKNAG